MTATFGPLALSSMWQQRFDDPDDLAPFFAAGRAMGFERFELSHTHSAAALASIPPDTAIATVHHPCPNDGPPALRPGDDATAPDPAARARWLAALRTTIATAQRLGARAVCAHLGTAHDVGVRRAWFELHSRFQAGQASHVRYVETAAELRDRLAAVEPAATARAVAVLADVVGDLRAAGVALGIETGYHAWELPTADGMRALLDGLEAAVPGAVVGPAAVVGAWLDSGHVGVQQHLGVATFAGWFEAVAAVGGGRGGRWVGVHWHDALGVRDHLAVGMGDVPIERVRRGLSAASATSHTAPLPTLEVDFYLSTDEVGEGARRLGRAPSDG